MNENVLKEEIAMLENQIRILQQQNQELKKQLEEYKDKVNWYENFKINKTIDKLRIKHNNQQKEFIDYMEEKIICYENYQNTNLGEYERNLYFDIYNDILEKYKEIIVGKE